MNQKKKFISSNEEDYAFYISTLTKAKLFPSKMQFCSLLVQDLIDLVYDLPIQ